MRLIDADALIERYGEPCHSFLDVVEDMPTIDAVPVVRCKDCRYRWDACRCPMYDDSGCYAPQDFSTDDGYCYRGVKMEKED